jgi:hypothetical protein
MKFSGARNKLLRGIFSIFWNYYSRLRIGNCDDLPVRGEKCEQSGSISARAEDLSMQPHVQEQARAATGWRFGPGL